MRQIVHQPEKEVRESTTHQPPEWHEFKTVQIEPWANEDKTPIHYEASGQNADKSIYTTQSSLRGTFRVRPGWSESRSGHNVIPLRS